MRAKISLLCALAVLVCAGWAQAFCGFYVGGADAKLFNDATMVVMMRDGTTTVLSMQNNYKGPPNDFAMVVPVPVVLEKENVKTLEDAAFERIDQLAAPRLVEYWEQDPCYRPPKYKRRPMRMSQKGGPPQPAAARGGAELGVKIEAQFKVGEYEIVILSAQDSAGLDTWLKQENYNIPDGAEPVLRPYVAQGMKFFVAKVDAKKVKFVGGKAELSPLRFHYDAKYFALPVRLGLLNSQGDQDLIVHILARGQRYELANYANVTVPTNIEVNGATKNRFGQFYMALFDRVTREHPGAIVTEYSWAASSCDPCPTPPLQPGDYTTFGADVIGADANQWGSNWVLTRLHARYDKQFLGEDLVFRAAPPIAGGRETGGPGKNETGALSAGSNNFQARYIIRYPWTGAIKCKNPRRGIWGGPPGGAKPKPKPAMDLAAVPRGKASMGPFLNQNLKKLEVLATPADPAASEQAKMLVAQAEPGAPAPAATDAPPGPTPTATSVSAPPATSANPPTPQPPATEPTGSSCGSCTIGSRRASTLGVLGLLLGLSMLGWRRRGGR